MDGVYPRWTRYNATSPEDYKGLYVATGYIQYNNTNTNNMTIISLKTRGCQDGPT